MPKALVRGSINIDEFYLLPHIVRPGETIASTGFSRSTGGKGANQAYAAGRAGANVVLDAQVGADGAEVVKLIASGGVDVSRVRVIDGEVTGRAIIQRAADGENSIVLHPGANFAASSGKVDLEGYTHLLLQNEIPLDDTLAYLRASGKAGIKTVYNPSPMPSREVLAAFPWDCLSYLIVNEGELADILAAFDDTPLDAKLSVKDRAIAQMHALHGAKGFAKTVAIVTTIGPDGVLVFDVKGAHPEVAYSPAAKARKVVDTTGAGDTFAGYFVAMLMDKGDDAPIAELIPTCLQACALTVENPGALESIPARADVEARLALKE
ncbi:putative ribokinase [Vanrija albida]|uniref:Ribokinase n=1 Tax=Vanrija albida TaxID=181172 RepID=A0ABR3Q5U3_9TREE